MTLRQTLIAAATGALLGAAPAFAQTAPPAEPAAKPATQQPQRPYGYQLMTPEERDAYRKQMQEAKTPEERAKLRDAHRAEIRKRADAQGITLQGRGGQPRMYGQELMTPEERSAYAERMRSAKTQDERIKLRDEHRAEMQKRAQEKGVTLPEPRGPGGAAGTRPPGGRGQMYGQELFTPDERKAFFDKMKAAQTPEERAQLRDEHRAVAEARAKEKGITLPEWRPSAQPGPAPAPAAPKAQ